MISNRLIRWHVNIKKGGRIHVIVRFLDKGRDDIAVNHLCQNADVYLRCRLRTTAKQYAKFQNVYGGALIVDVVCVVGLCVY